MTNKFDDIDKLLQEKMDGFQVESSSEDFAKFQKKLFGYRFFRFHRNVFNVYYLLLILGFTIAIIYCLLPDNQPFAEKSQNIKVQKRILKNDIQNSTGKKENNTDLLPAENKKTETVSTKKKITQPAVKNKKMTRPDKKKDSGFNTKSVTNDTTNIIETGNNINNDNNKLVYDTVITQKKVIVYDTVKTVIVKPKPEKK